MNLNILLVPCLLLLTEAESLLESSPLEHISEREPKTIETRSHDCCSSEMGTLTANIVYQLSLVSASLTDTVARKNDQIQRLDNRLAQVRSSLDDLDSRRRESHPEPQFLITIAVDNHNWCIADVEFKLHSPRKSQRRGYTHNAVENNLNDLHRRPRGIIKAESMLESSSLEDFIDLKPETIETRSQSCCSAVASDVSKEVLHKLLVVSTAIGDAETRINEEIRIRDSTIAELQIKYNYLDGRIRGK